MRDNNKKKYNVCKYFLKQLKDNKRTSIKAMFIAFVAFVALLILSGGEPFASVMASAKALDDVVVAIDAGHGQPDGGAVGITGVKESPINLKVAKLLREELIANGAIVIMIREGEEALSETKSQDFVLRSQKVNDSGADLVISIHMNKFPSQNVCGPQVFYSLGSSNGESLAKCIQERMNKATTECKDRVALDGDYYMLRSVEGTAVIVECGFLSNAVEEELLCNAGYQRKLAVAIAEGVVDYVKNNDIENQSSETGDQTDDIENQPSGTGNQTNDFGSQPSETGNQTNEIENQPSETKTGSIEIG